MDKSTQKINKTLMIGWSIIVGILLVAYLIECLKGVRTWEYMMAFTAVTAIPPLLCLIMYRKNNSSKKLRYYAIGGYFIMYTFVLMTGNTIVVFTYILPLFALIVLYHQPKLVLVLGAVSLAANIIFDVKLLLEERLVTADSADIEIQFALLLLCFGFLYFASRLYNQIFESNEEYVQEIYSNQKRLRRITLQTITTIANIIDAKDEYTKGHSFRVAEYSSALARELGYSEERAQDIKSIGLLHDIGKIGIPDAILNKPGKLTDSEFFIMRNHAEIGGNILEGNSMIEGLDAGARYHHERYDGRGYPHGLKGEEIPEIARIIGIADAYDAMTSNRIYRNRLTDESVIAEIKRCSGTQFDPNIAEKFINMLESGRLSQLSPDSVPEADGDLGMLKFINDLRTNTSDKDYLTGTLTREAGEQSITEAMAKNSGGLFLVDIANIGMTNEKHGLVAGDHVIKIAADVLSSRENIIVSRYTGDTFLCFASGISSSAEFENYLNFICNEIYSFYHRMTETEDNRICIGGVLTEDLENNYVKLVSASEKALYYVKQLNGSGWHIFSKNTIKPDVKNLSKVDLEHLINGIGDERALSETFTVEYPEFIKIYSFIKSFCERNKKEVNIILFTVSPIETKRPSVAERDEAMQILENAVNGVIRKIDVSLRFSSTQSIVLMSDPNDEVQSIAERIFNSFYRIYDKKNMILEYELENYDPTKPAASAKTNQ